MELKQFLSNLEKLETQSMNEYLRKIKVATDSLAAIQAPVSEFKLFNDILFGLDPAYAFFTIVQYCPRQTSFDDLRTKLTIFEQRVKMNNNRNNRRTCHLAFAATSTAIGGRTAFPSEQSAGTLGNKNNNSSKEKGRNNNRNNKVNRGGKGGGRNHNRNNNNQ